MRMVEDRRPLVDDLTKAAQELIDAYSLEDGQGVHHDVSLVTSKYDEVKRAIRDKVHLLNDALRPTVTDVSLYTHSYY